MKKSLNLKNLYAKKFKTFPFTGIWKAVMGIPESCGIWIIYGTEKNGKTWFCLKLAEYLSTFAKVLYISAEEGTGKDFIEACQRAKLDANNNKLGFEEYMTNAELREKLSKRGSARIVFIDNITVWQDEIKYGKMRQLKDDFPKVLFVYVAHEDKNEPFSATAKLAKKLAKIIVRVKGLACFVSGRCPQGVLTIDEDKAMLYHGMEQLTNN